MALSGRRTIICAIVGRLSSCAPIHRRSVSALVSSKRPVETGQQDKSCPTIAQIIVPRPLSRRVLLYIQGGDSMRDCVLLLILSASLQAQTRPAIDTSKVIDLTYAYDERTI